MERLWESVAREVARAGEDIDEAGIDRLCDLIAEARKIVVYGCGREALQIRGFAMRLYHLGLDVSVVGDMTTPPVGPGDLFLATSGPGELSTVNALIEEAKRAGAHTAALTANPEGSAARSADFTLLIPVQTMANDQGPQRSSVLPMGSVYEGALFVLFEVMVLKLQVLLSVAPETMRARHTNLE